MAKYFIGFFIGVAVFWGGILALVWVNDFYRLGEPWLLIPAMPVVFFIAILLFLLTVAKWDTLSEPRRLTQAELDE